MVGMPCGGGKGQMWPDASVVLLFRVLGHICVSVVRGLCLTSMMCISITIQY
jgi:hypothetical protein